MSNADEPVQPLTGTWGSRLARPVGYLSVGLVCAVTHNVVTIGATLAGLHYAPALVLSFAITTPLGYALHTLHTFATRLSIRQFARFTAGVSGGFVLSFAIMAVLCSGLQVSAALATPIATILLFVWNFASAHWAIDRGALVRPR